MTAPTFTINGYTFLRQQGDFTVAATRAEPDGHLTLIGRDGTELRSMNAIAAAPPTCPEIIKTRHCNACGQQISDNICALNCAHDCMTRPKGSVTIKTWERTDRLVMEEIER